MRFSAQVAFVGRTCNVQDTKRHEIVLLGGTHDELRVSADALIEVLSALMEGTRRAVRFFAEGQSLSTGPYPQRLSALTTIEITGLSPGSTVCALMAPPIPLSELMNVPFPGQLGFLPGEEDTCSAVELLAGVLASAAAGNRERLVADRPLLDACARFARAGGEEGIRIDRIAGSGGSVHVRASDAKIIEQLRDEIPAPRAVRVTGTLDTVSASSTKIILQLPDDKKVPAQLKNPDAEQLRDLIIRGGKLGQSIEKRFRLHAAVQRPLVCIVSHGELGVLAQRNGWDKA